MLRFFDLIDLSKSFILKTCYIERAVYGILGFYGVYKVIYYTLLDPLRKIPGPWLNRLSEISLIRANVNGDFTNYLLGLHEKYGHIVRVGPNKVSDARTKDFKKVLSTSRFKKSANYDGFANVHQNLFSTRNDEFNRMRKRQVGPALRKSGLGSIDSSIEEVCVDAFVKKLNSIVDAGNGSAEFNFFKYYLNVAADVIGLLTFSENFHAIENGDHPIIEWVDESMKNFGLSKSFPILKVAMAFIPSLSVNESKLSKFCLEAIDKRRQLIKSGKIDTDHVDILQMYITAVNTSNKKPLTDEELVAEMVTMVIVGVISTSATMTWLTTFYLLYPKVYNRVVDEIRTTFPDKNKKITAKEAHEKLPYFTATIYEGLRFRGSVGGSLNRDVPNGGVELSGYFIPQDTIVSMFIPGCHADTEVWENPKSYNPDRFLGPNGDELKKELVSFSTGVRACVGRNLAYMEIFMIMSNLLRNFDISAPKDWEYNTNILDPTRNNEPLLPRDITNAVRTPANPERDSRVVITRCEH
ncbi:Versicolorin B desaturase [Smittium mucronatum]|uniref:Versicolorin B desaturase n=1 Tax=Smittium mucronatum TaxID=133383 RepID=A0A1R0H200_9FUNG|nr:Versicolorin B desaturase [Smittium mucronatum]